MNKKILIVFLLLIAVPCVSANIIIINETEKDHYALEIVSLNGNLRDNKLTVNGHGEVISGNDVKIYLFGPSSDFLVSNVIVNNQRSPVSFDNKGYYFIAQKGKFDFNAKLGIRTIGQIRLYIPGPLNEILFDITNGYTVDHNRFGLYDDTIIIQRTEKVAKSVEGEFHFMYDAYVNNFRYNINLRSFGSDLGRFTLPLKNAETIHEVIGALKWEVLGNNLILELEGDSSRITISGTFNDNNLIVPFDEGNHHVLIESDPEKKISITTSAREIDLRESPIYSKYSNARAFLATTNQPINVNVRQLGLLPSLSASISRSEQILSITPQGGIVGNTKYRYSNTGVDYLPVEIPGTPLYASTSRGPVKLTKDDIFMLAFPKQSNGLIEIIYYETIEPLKTISYFEVPLTTVDIPITKQDISIILPKDYFVINVFGLKGGSELPKFKSLLIFFLLIGFVSFMLFRNYNYMVFLSLFLGILYLFNLSLFLIVLGAILILIVRRYTYKMNIKWKTPLMILGIVFAVILVLVGSIILFSSLMRTASYDMRGTTLSSSISYEEAFVAEDSLRKIGTDDASITVPMREGVLPVKLELPQLGKRITVTDHLVTKENPTDIKILMIATWLIYIIYLLGIVFGYLCIKKLRNDWNQIKKV